MLLAMLGEADVLAGQVISPRSPPDALARLMSPLEDGEGWVIPNLCAYVPQTTWLQNATIKENILFNLPFDEQRYQETLEVRLIPLVWGFAYWSLGMCFAGRPRYLGGRR